MTYLYVQLTVVGGLLVEDDRLGWLGLDLFTNTPYGDLLLTIIDYYHATLSSWNNTCWGWIMTVMLLGYLILTSMIFKILFVCLLISFSFDLQDIISNTQYTVRPHLKHCMFNSLFCFGHVVTHTKKSFKFDIEQFMCMKIQYFFS